MKIPRVGIAGFHVFRCRTAAPSPRSEHRRIYRRKAAFKSPDREPSRLAAHSTRPVGSENQNVRELCEPLRAGTARGPVVGAFRLESGCLT
jgi:hypothetical protein